MKGYLIVVLTGLMMFSGYAFAGRNGDPSGHGERREPPPEAYAACSDKSEGEKVRITTPHGDTIMAVCRLIDGKLFALPDREPGRHGGRREPPPEAYAACSDKNEGEKVRITTPHGGTIMAVCRLMNGKLFALPDHETNGDRKLPPPDTEEKQ